MNYNVDCDSTMGLWTRGGLRKNQEGAGHGCEGVPIPTDSHQDSDEGRITPLVRTMCAPNREESPRGQPEKESDAGAPMGAMGRGSKETHGGVMTAP